MIAEGVESVAHGELLLQLGCELGQGYGIAVPMPAEALFAWAAAWRPDASWTAWRERPAGRADLALTFAEVRHRQWLRGIDNLLSGAEPVAPVQDDEACHFTAWLDGHGAERYGACMEFCRVIAVHEQMHRVGKELLAAHAAGRFDEARARQPELHGMHQELAALLRMMARSGMA